MSSTIEVDAGVAAQRAVADVRRLTRHLMRLESDYERISELSRHGLAVAGEETYSAYPPIISFSRTPTHNDGPRDGKTPLPSVEIDLEKLPPESWRSMFEAALNQQAVDFAKTLLQLSEAAKLAAGYYADYLETDEEEEEEEEDDGDQ